jgi:hypothetical protein
MVRISISIAAFEALAATSPLGIIGCESELTPNGERLFWLEERWVNKLDAIRMPGESYSDIILWLVEIGRHLGSSRLRRPKDSLNGSGGQSGGQTLGQSGGTDPRTCRR